MLIMAFITAALIFKLCLLNLWYYLDDLTKKKKKGKFLKTLGTSYITMVPVVCPCLDSDRWRNIYSLKLQMISSQKTTFSSLTWDHNICKVTKSCTILWTIVLWWLLCSVGEFIRLFWNSDGTTDIARCFVFGTPNERQKVRVFANVLRSQYHGAVWDIFLLQKHANITCVLCWQDFVSLSFIGLLTISSVSLLLLRIYWEKENSQHRFLLDPG